MSLYGTEIKLRSELLDFQDINWVNAAMKNGIHNFRSIFFQLLSISCTLFIFVYVFSSLTDWNLFIKYDTDAPGINCNNVLQQYGDNIKEMAYIEQRFGELSDFPISGDYVFLNERITRTGAL